MVIFGCLVSRFCQPIDSPFAFSSVQFLIQLLCCSCSFNSYSSPCVSLCLFVSSMIFLCFRLLPLLEHPLFVVIASWTVVFHHQVSRFCMDLPPVVTPQCSLPTILFHCFSKYCSFRLFTIFHVLGDILGIVLSYCLILKSPPFDLDFVLSLILSFLLCTSPQIHHNQSVL